MCSAPVSVLQALDGAQVAAADALACAGWLRDSKRLRGWLDAFDAQVTARLDVLAKQGESFGSEHTHVRCSGVSAKEATKLKERARALEDAPDFADALTTGDVTAGHVDQLAAVAGHASEEVRSALLDTSAELLAHAKTCDPAKFGRHVRDRVRRLERDAGMRRGEQQRRDTYLSWNVTANGMYSIHAKLHPELGNQVVRALNRHVAALLRRGERAGIAEFVNRTVNRSRLAAEALGELAAGGHQKARSAVADVGLLVDAQTLAEGGYHEHSVCETDEGAPLAVDSVRRLLCNGFVTPIVVGQDGNVLDVGRTTRTANRPQRRALRAMYRTCALEGCDVHFDQCEIHHIVWWERHGRTDLANLIPVCAHHHHQIHQLGWRLVLDEQRTLTVTDGTGEVLMRVTPDVPHAGRRLGGRAAVDRRTGPAAAGGTPQHDPVEQQTTLLVG